MRRLYILLLFLLLGFHISKAQDWLGNITDRHSGLLGMHVQPAWLVSSPYKYDINILGINIVAINMDVIESINNLSGGKPSGFLKNEKEFLIRGAIQLPSFMWKIDDRNAVGFEVKSRPIWFTEDADGSALRTLIDNFQDDELHGVDLSSRYLTSRTHWWTDFAGTYSRRIWQNARHRVDGGATLKLVTGSMSGYINIDNLAFVMANSDTIERISGRLQFVYNNELDALSDNGEVNLFNRSTLGLSFGFEYGFSPEGGDEKLRVGLSITDIGRIKYGRSNRSGEFNLLGEDIALQPFRDAQSLEELSQVARETFDEISVTSEDFFVYLPTQLGLQFDYHIKKFWYINFSSYVALLGGGRNLQQTKNFDNFVLTPRIEKAKWGIQLPVYYNPAGGMSAGLSGRWGPLYIGFSNLFQSLLIDKDINRLSGYIGFRFHRLTTWQKKNRKG